MITRRERERDVIALNVSESTKRIFSYAELEITVNFFAPFYRLLFSMALARKEKKDII